MIPFFRKIRKKMADDNKPLKYMRYAVGEIILVVIGILIALQVNNWNEDRKKSRVIENVLMDTMFELPSEPDIDEVVVNEDVITKGSKPILVHAKKKKELSTSN